MNVTSRTPAVRLSQRHSAASGYSSMLGADDSALVGANRIATDQQDGIEAWANEVGAGDDLDR
jgi:hypothetical protein